MKPIHTIDDVIANLDAIILETQANNNPLGYFAALYRKVTIKVKEGIINNSFDNGPRMERLDVIFASRYIMAYFAYNEQKTVTDSWKIAFDLSTDYWPIVLQHLLIGMNAHINLDLGIAAAEVSIGENIEDLKNDFNKINAILSALVLDVENDLAKIWPRLKKILKYTRKVDGFLLDFSMKLARDGAWKFAVALANVQDNQFNDLINRRDQQVAEKGLIVTKPGKIAGIILGIVRLGERGTVAEKINDLKD